MFGKINNNPDGDEDRDISALLSNLMMRPAQRDPDVSEPNMAPAIDLGLGWLGGLGSNNGGWGQASGPTISPAYAPSVADPLPPPPAPQDGSPLLPQPEPQPIEAPVTPVKSEAVAAAPPKPKTVSAPGKGIPTLREMARDDYYRVHIEGDETMRDLWYVASTDEMRQKASEVLHAHWGMTTIHGTPFTWAVLTSAHWVRLGKFRRFPWQTLKHTGRYPCLYFNSGPNKCNQNPKHVEAGFHYCLCCGGEDHGVYKCTVWQKLEKRIQYLADSVGLPMEEYGKFFGFDEAGVVQTIKIKAAAAKGGEGDIQARNAAVDATREEERSAKRAKDAAERDLQRIKLELIEAEKRVGTATAEHMRKSGAAAEAVKGRDEALARAAKPKDTPSKK